jgi:hypothetical protein
MTALGLREERRQDMILLALADVRQGRLARPSWLKEEATTLS